MPISIDQKILREIIMDHYSHPSHKNKPVNEDEYFKVEMNSASCIDDLFIYLKVKDDIIVDALFDGIACTISTASTDILCDLLIKKKKKEALYIIEQYQNMIFEKPYDEECIGELIAFINTHKQASRIKCATLGSEGFKKLLENNEDEK